MDDSLAKFEGSDIIKWAKELKHDEKVARKYEGVTTVKDILQKAREDGYNFTEKELLDFNLDLVAGGAVVDVKVDSKVDTSTHTSTVENKNETSNKTSNMNATVEGSNNNFSWQN